MNLISTNLLNNWRTGKKGGKNASLLAALLILTLPALLTGCSGGDAPAAGATSTSSTVNKGYTLTLKTSQTSIANDGTDSATITATVIDKYHVALENETVTFATTAGVMSARTVTTDSNGRAVIELSSGDNASNQLVSVSATCSGASASLPLQIIGNSLTITPLTGMAIGATQKLTALIKDANDAPINQTTVTFTIVNAADGFVSLSLRSKATGSDGIASIDITGLAAGTAQILVSGGGATEQISVTVAAPTQVFAITAPATDPASMTTAETLTFTVRAPAPMANVTFETTGGNWVESGSNTITVAVGDDEIAEATLSSATAITATVKVKDTANPGTMDTATVNISAPASAANKVILQAVKIIMPTTPIGSTTPESIAITASVLTIDNQVVKDAQVNFSMSNNPGGGERLSDVTVNTNSFGQAATTFYSGTLGSTGDGVIITATVNATTPPGGATAHVDIVITGLPGSIALGRSTVITSGGDETYYEQTITATVTDVSNHGVADVPISLKLWPTAYFLGAQVYDTDLNCIGYGHNHWPPCTTTFAIPNEDDNSNLVLDPDEDTGPYDINTQTMHADGFLTPHNATAGTIIIADPPLVTDADGKAEFKIRYLKQYAMWVEVRLQAMINVQGTETMDSLTWTLEASIPDVEACNLFASPFGYYVEEACPPAL